MKNRGLIKPSSDGIAVCKIVERCIRKNVGPNQLIRSTVSLTIVSEVLNELIGINVFECLNEHQSSKHIAYICIAFMIIVT